MYVSENIYFGVHDSRMFVVLVGEDNPAFEGVFEFCSLSAGGSICASSFNVAEDGDMYSPSVCF